MRGAVVVVIGINAAAPTATPAIAGEQCFAARSRARAALEHPSIPDERHPRVVGHDAVIVKPMLFNRRSSFTAHHRRSFHTGLARHARPGEKRGQLKSSCASAE